jgi:hypothetical protein
VEIKMKSIKRNAAILSIVAVAAGFFLVRENHKAGEAVDGTAEAASASRSNTADGETSGKATGLVRDLAAFRRNLTRNLYRVAVFDETMSDQELSDFENELVNAAMYDERARKIMIEELDDAFSKRRPSSIYLLERVLVASDPGRSALMAKYAEMVIDQQQDADFFAMQGIHAHAKDIPAEQMKLLFDKALGQLDRYDSFARYSPAMTFGAAAVKNGTYQPTPDQRRALQRNIENRQAVATQYIEHFFAAQSMIWMSERSQRETIVANMLRNYPNRGTLEAVLESIQVGDFTPSMQLLQSMDAIAKRILTEKDPSAAGRTG